jgi:hypothetical protein
VGYPVKTIGGPQARCGTLQGGTKLRYRGRLGARNRRLEPALHALDSIRRVDVTHEDPRKVIGDLRRELADEPGRTLRRYRR